MSPSERVENKTEQSPDDASSLSCPLQGYPLDCLEVWGGSGDTDNKLSVTGLDVWAWSSAADDIAGGDLYFVSMCACAEVSRFFVADVSGHDAVAAEIASRLRKLMRKHINKPDQTHLAEALNRDFDRITCPDKFATALLATFFPPTRHLILCNAGHPRPLWYQALARKWVPLDRQTPQAIADVRNLPLGIIDDAKYRQFAVKLEPGDLVLVYTDGIIEARMQGGEMVREQGLCDQLARLDGTQPQAIVPALRDWMRQMQDTPEAVDDRTLLLLHANGQKPPRQSVAKRFRIAAKMLGLLNDTR